jgi:hypothetical protein
VSTQQRSRVSTIVVDSQTASVLRRQTLIVLEANHHHFEELLEFGAEAQYALSVIYRDAFAVLDALGWPAAAAADAGTASVPLTDGHVDQLRRRRHDLGATNIDRLDGIEDAAAIAAIRPQLDADRSAAQTLDRVFAAYLDAVTAARGAPVV